MSEIEWQSDTTYQPASITLEAYIRLRGIGSLAGDRNEQDGEIPLVFITSSALEGLNVYLESDVSREHGGVLIGLPYTDTITGKTFVDVRAAIPAFYSEGSPTSLQFNPEAWEYISGLIEESFPGHIVVGWFHSHPGLGVYMSGTDRATQRSFYAHPWNLALVVDPLAHDSAWFAGAGCIPLRIRDIILYAAGLDSGNEAASIGRSTTIDQEASLWSRLGWLLPAVCMLSLVILWLPGRPGMRS